MATTLKVRRIGNSLGVIVPREIAEQLQIEEGDTLNAVVESGGSVRLSAFDPGFEEAMSAFSRTRRKYRNSLRALAR